jgi:hypothetical protein
VGPWHGLGTALEESLLPLPGIELRVLFPYLVHVCVPTELSRFRLDMLLTCNSKVPPPGQPGLPPVELLWDSLR